MSIEGDVSNSRAPAERNVISNGYEERIMIV